MGYAYNLSFLGAGIIAMALGSLFFREVQPFAYAILSLALVANIYFLDYGLEAHKCGKVSAHCANVVGLAGTLLLLFYFGIQSPLIPFKEPLIVLGAILMAPFVLKKLRG